MKDVTDVKFAKFNGAKGVFTAQCVFTLSG